jgi:hypothetical protein
MGLDTAKILGLVMMGASEGKDEDKDEPEDEERKHG